MKKLALCTGLIAVAILLNHLRRSDQSTPAQQTLAQPEALQPAPNIATDASPMFAPASSATSSPPPRELAANSLMHRIARGDTNAFKLQPEQIQAFLARNKTNAESLLAAFNVTDDPELLIEAARRYPSNASVLVSVLGHDLFPEQRRQWIDQLKQLAGDNSLPNYLSAREYLKTQQPQQAFQELAAASAKGRFNDYTTDRAQGLQDLYLSSGYSTPEAKALSTLGVQEPSMPGLRDLAGELSTLEGQYAKAGDSGSVAAIAKMGLGLSADIKDAGTKSMADQMLGASVERDFLTGLDPNGTYDFLGQPITERLAQLRADRQSALADSKLLTDWMTTATEPQLVSYFDRMRLYGESSAVNWAKTQTGN